MISALFERRASLENPNTSLGRFFAELDGGVSEGGVVVSESRSLALAPVWGCVRVLAHQLASLPIHVYQRVAGGREKAPQHPVAPLLSTRPNPLQQTRFALILAGMFQALLRGSAYLHFPRGANGHVERIELLDADAWHPVVDDRGRKALITHDRTRVLVEGEFAHVFGFSLDGITGLSPIKAARRAFSMGISLADFGETFMARGARLSGVLQHPGQLGPEAVKNIQSAFREQFGGASRAGGVPVLEEGMVYTPISISPEDAQFLESRQFTTKEICGIFGVPPHMVGEMSDATFSNIEHQSRNFYQTAVVHWCEAWEGALNSALFPAGRYYVKFEVRGLLRGDVETRANYYATGRQWGWFSADDVRELEDMNPLPDGQGQAYLVPMNMAPPDGLDDDDEDGSEGRIAVLAPSIARVATRCTRWEAKRLGNAIKRARQAESPAARMIEELETIYAELGSYLAAELEPLFAGLGHAGAVPQVVQDRVRVRKGAAVEGLRGGDLAAWDASIRDWMGSEPARWAGEIEGRLRDAESEAGRD